MTIYYSPSNNGFYDDNLKADYDSNGSWPDDAVAISEKWYCYLLDKQSEGKTINPNEDGQPVVTEPEPLTEAEMINLAEKQKQSLLQFVRDKTQFWQTQLSLGIISDSDRQQLINWMKYVQQVEATDTSTLPVIFPEQPE
ncbi:tail fiber assembly protein [Escherichia marmotae]|uniref:tail fiber assembly protein n=1 Tax=Escherichia marmotae TaxID=1499973 RepID=UPI0028143585|nr:tail fiber assembly protein [Escherichia marmotae]MDQ9210590.1 tail fiber assembly protein [Escherichia marmotae]